MKTDDKLYKPNNYDTAPLLNLGQSYIDENFGEVIERITDSMNQPDTAMGAANAKVTSATVEYATICPFNSDSTRLLILHGSYFALYDSNGKYLNDLRYGSSYVNASAEPRWSRTNSTNFYFVNSNKLMMFDTLTSIATVVQEFAEYVTTNSQGQNGLRSMGEGDISEDGQYWALAGELMGGTQEIFLYDLKNHTKGKTFKATKFDNIYVTPDNNVIVGYYSSGEARFNGVELYDKDMKFIRQVAHALGHQDVARDDNGDEVLVWESAADPKSPFGNTAGIVKIRLADAKQTMIFDHGWGISLHIYGPKIPGWVLVSTFRGMEDILSWTPYLNEILKVKLDGTEIQRLCHHRSRPLNDYTFMPKATGNSDLTKIVYNSNCNMQRIKNYPKNYSDVYMINSKAADIVVPVTTTPPVNLLEGFNKVGFSKSEGKEYLLKLKVVNGELKTEMWEK